MLMAFKCAPQRALMVASGVQLLGALSVGQDGMRPLSDSSQGGGGREGPGRHRPALAPHLHPDGLCACKAQATAGMSMIMQGFGCSWPLN